MRPRTEQSRLMIAVAASVLAHTLGIAALAGSYGTLGDENQSPITAEDELRSIRLGIERSEAQTVDWIGYDEYLLHVAPPAEQNQAPMALGGAQASAPAQPSPERAPSGVVDPIVPEKPKTIEEMLFEQLFADIDDPTFFALREPAPEENEAPDSEEKPEEDSTPQQPSVPAEESETVDEREGDSDKDADAVSKETDETVTEYTLGKPLAAQGLDFKTVFPTFSDRTWVMARPRNLIVRIHFNRTGKVTFAKIEKSSGEPDVDRPILDSLYRWRAVGDRLLELPEDEPDATLSIKINYRLQ